MKKLSNFKGKIFFSKGKTSEKKTLMSYENTLESEQRLEDQVIAAFENLNLTCEEKKLLSIKHRKTLNQYRQINPFSLSEDATKLVQQINNCKESSLVIEAYDYGAYICLAALFSGKISQDKKVVFEFEKSPIALFPKKLLKNTEVLESHKIVFRINDSCWLSPFSSLYNHERIKCSYKKAA